MLYYLWLKGSMLHLHQAKGLLLKAIEKIVMYGQCPP